MTWQQTYNPLHNVIISTLAASFPLIILLTSIVFWKMKAHSAAGLGLLSALLVAIGVFHMPGDMAIAAAGFGAAFGLLPIGWIILNVIFLYRLTTHNGQSKILEKSIIGI